MLQCSIQQSFYCRILHSLKKNMAGWSHAERRLFVADRKSALTWVQLDHSHPFWCKTMHDTIRRSYYWPNMANNVYNYVKKCQWFNLFQHHQTHQRLLELFQADWLLKIVLMNISGPLSKTKSGEKFIVEVTDCYFRLIRAIPTDTTTAADVAKRLEEDWVMPYSIHDRLFIDRQRATVCTEIFNSACVALSTSLMKTTANHLQTNGQAERLKKTIVNQIHHYMSKNWDNLEHFAQPQTHGSNAQTHATPQATPLPCTCGVWNTTIL